MAGRLVLIPLSVLREKKRQMSNGGVEQFNREIKGKDDNFLRIKEKLRTKLHVRTKSSGVS
jgi:hypothetical protein